MRVSHYKVKWEHNISGTKWDSAAVGELTLTGQSNTCCQIWDTSFVDPQVVAAGCSYLHPRDQYCKDVGRKLSLARALKEWHVSKELRAMFWTEYKAMLGGKW